MLQQLDTRYAATLVHPQTSDRALTRSMTLEQAPEVLPQVQRHYQQALRDYLLPLMTRQLEARLRSAHADRQQLIGHLRAYLMLSQPERLDTDYLQQWMSEEWQHRYPEQSDVQAQLNAHLERLLALPWQPAAADQELITRVRDQLQQESLAQLTYRLLREQARALPTYRLDNQLGTDHQLLASRPTSIPGFYTRPGYQSLFQQQGPALIERLLEDNWVLGNRSQLTPSEQRQLLVEVEALYFQDYTDQWVRALASLRMAALRNGRAVSDLSALSASSAPQLLLLQQLREHTRLIDPQLDHAAPASPAKQALQQQFADLHGLIDNDGNPTAVLLQSQQALTQLQLQLAQLYNSGDSGQLAFEMARKRMQHQADAISATRDAAAALPAPLNGWINQLASDAWGQVLADAGRYLNQRYRTDLYSVYRSAFALAIRSAPTAVETLS
ncbi:ImcF-related family protein [Halopseudomonas pachastrellae]|nr:ImcF-related family protein [Halopseudomonas pachastrellae]